MLKIKFDKDYIIDVTGDYSPMRKNTFTKTETVELVGRELSNAIDKKSKELGLRFMERAELTKEERFVERDIDYKKLFSKGDGFEMRFGVNIIVGDNGCGKSTLIELLIKENKESLKGLTVMHVDMEKSNPHINKPNPDQGITYSAQEIKNMWMWSAESHGETRQGVLEGLLTYDFDMLILDEPEQGLSLQNQKKYLNKLIEKCKDMIIVTHSKVFVENVDSVFDVETMKWVESGEYLKSLN